MTEHTAEKDALLAALQRTPITEAETEVARRYWLGEATLDDLTQVMQDRLQRAIDSVIPPGVTS